MPTPPKRYKDVRDLTPEEHFRRLNGEERIETDEYRAYTRGVLRGAGLDVPPEYAEGDGETAVDNLSPEAWYRRLQGE